MNQILYVDKPKKGFSFNFNFGANMKLIIVTICIMIFAVFLIIRGVSGFSKKTSSGPNGVISKDEPAVTMKEVNGKIEINVIHNKAIDKIVYSWNDGEETTLQGKGNNNITETIDMPIGKNTLNLKVIDAGNKQFEYSEEYYKSDEDKTEPVIEFIVEGSKVKIIAKDETEISYMMYHWDDEDDTVVEVGQDYKFEIEEKITILKGEHILTVVAVDANGNEARKEQLYKGAKKPTIKIEQEENEWVITVNDDENIQKIEMTFNGEFFSSDVTNTGEPLNMTEAVIRQELKRGLNTITITAYNVNSLSEQVTKEVTIQ